MTKTQQRIDEVEALLDNLYMNISKDIKKEEKILGALAFVKNTLVDQLQDELGVSSTKGSLSGGQQLPGSASIKTGLIEDCLIAAGRLQQLASKLVMHGHEEDFDVKLILDTLFLS